MRAKKAFDPDLRIHQINRVYGMGFMHGLVEKYKQIEIRINIGKRAADDQYFRGARDGLRIKNDG